MYGATQEQPINSSRVNTEIAPPPGDGGYQSDETQEEAKDESKDESTPFLQKINQEGTPADTEAAAAGGGETYFGGQSSGTFTISFAFYGLFVWIFERGFADALLCVERNRL